MPTILLVRHGQASFGSSDYDRLSALGREQSVICAGTLADRDLRIQRITSGSLQRQRDTAAPLASRLAQPVAVDDRWNEYAMEEIIAAHPPDLPPTRPSSREFQEILEAALTGWIAAGEATPADESWPAFRDRVQAGLHAFAASLDSGSTGVVFTSGGVIATVCAELLGLPVSALLALNRVTVNTGITKLVAGRRALSVISFNDHAHLEVSADQLITYR